VNPLYYSASYYVLLELSKADTPLSAAAISETIKVSRSTAWRSLIKLKELGKVEEDSLKRWSITLSGRGDLNFSVDYMQEKFVELAFKIASK